MRRVGTLAAVGEERIDARGDGRNGVRAGRDDEVAANYENVKGSGRARTSAPPFDENGKPGTGPKAGHGPEGQPPFDEDGKPGKGPKPA